MDQADAILVEVAAPGVTPDTVAARGLLELAAAYVDAISRIVEEDSEEPLKLTGLHVVAKCAAVKLGVDPAPLAFEAGQRLHAFLSGAQHIPAGFRSHVGRVEAALRDLPPTYEPAARIRESGREHVFRLVISRPALELPPREIIHLRARPLRAGGSRSVVRFDGNGEAKAFTLLAPDWEMVRKAGSALLKPVDIVARVERDADGNIVDGKLLELEIADLDSRGAWERWYAANREHITFDPHGGKSGE